MASDPAGLADGAGAVRQFAPPRPAEAGVGGDDRRAAAAAGAAKGRRGSRSPLGTPMFSGPPQPAQSLGSWLRASQRTTSPPNTARSQLGSSQRITSPPRVWTVQQQANPSGVFSYVPSLQPDDGQTLGERLLRQSRASCRSRSGEPPGSSTQRSFRDGVSPRASVTSLRSMGTKPPPWSGQQKPNTHPSGVFGYVPSLQADGRTLHEELCRQQTQGARQRSPARRASPTRHTSPARLTNTFSYVTSLGPGAGEKGTLGERLVRMQSMSCRSQQSEKGPPSMRRASWSGQLHPQGHPSGAFSYVPSLPPGGLTLHEGVERLNRGQHRSASPAPPSAGRQRRASAPDGGLTRRGSSSRASAEGGEPITAVAPCSDSPNSGPAAAPRRSSLGSGSRQSQHRIVGVVGDELDAEVVSFLKKCHLAEFAPVIMREGYNDMVTLRLVEDSELHEMGMGKGHIRRLRDALSAHEFSPKVGHVDA